MARKIEIQIVGDADSLNRALGKAGSSTQSTFSKISKGARIASFAVGGGLAIAAKVGWDELAEGARVGAQTNAVLKSTGGAAHVTAGHVSNLANQILNYSGIDDEAVQSGENMLLTFKNIQNSAGKGNDIFDQSTKVLADMSTAMGTDMSTSAIQLGKALNDPVKGITALTRVGVTFNDQQKKQIAAMVKAGDTAGAQKIILKELNSEFGGSAKAAGQTLPGQLKIAQESLKNVAASIMQALVPAITLVSQKLLAMTQFMARNQGLTKLLVAGLAVLAVTLGIVSVATTVYATAVKVATFAAKAFRLAMAALDLVLDANPIALAVLALVALAAAFVIAYRRSSTFRAIVQGAFHGVQAVAGAVVSFISAHWRALFPVIALIVGVIKMVASRWSTISSAVGAVVGVVRGHINTLKSIIQSVASVVRSVAGRVSGAWDTVASAVQGIIDKIDTLISKITSIPSPGGVVGKALGFLASGGPAMAGHSYLVGERGPEILNMGSRSGYVHNASSSRRMLGAAGGGDVFVTVLLDGDPVRAMVKASQDGTARRVRGGRTW